MPGPHVVDVSTQTFEQEVVARSQQVPVVVDFWAPWCGPCKTLGPVLEKLAAEFGGRFVLAKVNVDENPEIAAQVQSIPLVLAFVEGRPVDQFAGALPEPQVRQWLERLLPSPAEELLAEGLQLEATDPKAAEAKFREAAEFAPDDDRVKIHLARVLTAEKRYDEAEPIIAQLEKRGFLEPEAEQVKAQLELRHAAEDAGGLEEARRAAEADPNNLELQVALGDALAAAGRHREALETLLSVVERDKSGAGVAAKDAMVNVFEVLGNASELTGEYRRKLATLLY